MKWPYQPTEIARYLGGLLCIALGGAMLSSWGLLRLSLPTLDGQARLATLADRVRIQRDALGVVTLTATTRLDVARALGFVHAQDRFFQMDLLRRRGSGALQPLFGPRAAAFDDIAQRFQLRQAAVQAYDQLVPLEKNLLIAYAEGVNAGIQQRAVAPFEYWLLWQSPQTWQPVDSLSVVHALFLDLQQPDRPWELLNRRLLEGLGVAWAVFLLPDCTFWEAPLVADDCPPPQQPVTALPPLPSITPTNISLESEQPPRGSNAWAVGGALTAHGAGLLANDMHLSMTLPNWWYRAQMTWENGPTLVGITLPGTPALVAGSNGSLAWGFTNAYVQTQTADYWLAQDAAAVNVGLIALETATTVAEALPLAQRSGIPVQNFLVVDQRGNLGWTLAGRHLGEDTPQVINPPEGRLWSANQRHEPALPDGGYDLGVRAATLRAALFAADRFDEAAFWALQLDDDGAFFRRWQALLLATLQDVAVDHPDRVAAQGLVINWDGRARVDSRAYWLIRRFRHEAILATLTPILARLPPVPEEPSLSPYDLRRYEMPAWMLLTAQPDGILAAHEVWPALRRRAAIATLDAAQGLTRTWGDHNRVQFRHPLSYAVPLLGYLTDLAPVSLPGDIAMLRVQTPRFGATQRLVVAPGHEDQGRFHMPGGQSGHPLSPFYRAGHAAWVQGEPLPLVPGPPQHELVLIRE